ncbi:hypothetical protein V5799_010929 [Amblyomma americanum]|uniref:Uncharacterized protein n=1 Tax=Amblyomma americanum TaxID=6943 RepID=A0AAQ4EIF6_AMBAM
MCRRELVTLPRQTQTPAVSEETPDVLEEIVGDAHDVEGLQYGLTPDVVKGALYVQESQAQYVAVELRILQGRHQACNGVSGAAMVTEACELFREVAGDVAHP